MTSSFLLLFIYFFTLEFGKTLKGFPDNSKMEHLTFQKAAINFNPMESFIFKDVPLSCALYLKNNIAIKTSYLSAGQQSDGIGLH